jgi:hypothetical protein
MEDEHPSPRKAVPETGSNASWFTRDFFHFPLQAAFFGSFLDYETNRHGLLRTR